MFYKDVGWGMEWYGNFDNIMRPAERRSRRVKANFEIWINEKPEPEAVHPLTDAGIFRHLLKTRSKEIEYVNKKRKIPYKFIL